MKKYFIEGVDSIGLYSADEKLVKKLEDACDSFIGSFDTKKEMYEFASDIKARHGQDKFIELNEESFNEWFDWVFEDEGDL
jgi:hypothetical protein